VLKFIVDYLLKSTVTPNHV